MMPLRATALYIRSHWRGEQGLGWSFFVNLIGLRLLLFALHEWLLPGFGHGAGGPVLVLALVFHGAVFVWQAVGVLRAAEAHCRDSGSMAPVWGAQLGTGLMLFWVLSYGWQAWQSTLAVTPAGEIQAELEARRQARTRLAASDDGRALLLEGTLELGLTKRLGALLEAQPEVEEIVLASSGGNIYEARGVSRLISARGLDTRVIADCSSACTLVFVAGARRILAPGGRLGFHQYRVDADYAVLTSDPAGEQARDREAFAAAGVAGWFLDRMFDASAEGIWYPSPPDLVAAGVVTELDPAT